MTNTSSNIAGKKRGNDYRHDPHSILGIHPVDEYTKVIRLWRPGAAQIYLEVFGKVVEAEREDPSGLFSYRVPAHTTNQDYRIYHSSGMIAHDPYGFSKTIGEFDLHLFSRGVHYKLYEMMGGRVCEHQGVRGCKFALWAPSAGRVSLVGDFNHWDGLINPLRSIGGGIWEIFIPGLNSGERYKFEIETCNGFVKAKADPYALYSELRPNTASITFDVDAYEWKDAGRRARTLHEPLNIYEVHLGSWKRDNGAFLNYREIAHALADYCSEMGFTHVELMPIAEHPLDESWGYQVTGFYAVTSRFGTPADFQYFVDHLHQKNIGVILDWVAAHFPTDDFSLAQFDGTSLYEHADSRKGFHPHWNTCIFNYGRFEVSNFLLASALFWLDKMHVDGLRVDAVASMLYLDYGREEGEWIPNPHGGRENLEAIEFIKHLNSVVHEKFPQALVFAEESTSFTGVTHPLEGGGLGFDMKWNMGWMNDTLSYFKTDPLFRHYHHDKLTFGLIYAFSEKFILVLSHDEVVHGKASLLSKMPGDDWQKFAGMRLLYSYMMCQPGKKLLFMGGEIGSWQEWSCKEELPWYLLAYDRHKALQTMIREINHFYQGQEPLWQRDFDDSGFEWIDFSDRKNGVISYLRKAEGRCLACVHNFTPSYFSEYFIPLKNVVEVKEVFNTDREEYGGSGKVGRGVHIHKDPEGRVPGFATQLSPLATMIFEVQF